MKSPLPSVIAATFFCLVLSTNVKAIEINVSGASGPWDVSLNPGYSYGVPVGGQNNVNLAPAVVDSLAGLNLVAGHSLLIYSLTPGQATLLAGAGGTLYSDANGVSGWGSEWGSPAQYMQGTVYLEELVGTFADNGVIVGTPFAIGNGPTTVVIPASANELLMGVNDGWYNDNGGSVRVSVTDTSAAVPETCPTVLLLCSTLVGLHLFEKVNRLRIPH